MANLDEIQIKISQDSSNAAAAIESLIASLEKLEKSTDLSKTAENIKGLSGSVDNLSNASKKLEKIDFATAMKGISGATFGALKGLAGWGVGLAVVGKQLANSVGLASNYIQTVNMLNITMGEGAEEAKEFAEELGDVLGLNPADTMNFQATFHNLFVGFGNDMKSAQLMSKNLTQLSYDMASFYGELVGSDPQAAAEKLRLGMAGTIEPIQRLGYAIKEADLQAVAARQGLNVNIRNLNTASKSMLRYIAIMEQSTHVQGNMARTFATPATAMMVYKSSIKQLSTEIGKTLLPMLMATIPYMQAFVRGLLDMVKTINNILGIELPKIGSDEQRQSIASLGDEATETGKKMKKAFMLGIDELNVLDSSADNAGAGFQDITGQLTLPEYNMLEGFSGDKLKEIEDKLKPLQPLFDGLALAFAGFYSAISGFTDTYLYPWLVNIGDWMKNNPETVQNLGKFLGDVAIGLFALKAVGALGNLFGIPQLITGIQTANGWLATHTKMWKNVVGIAVLFGGALMTVIGIMNIIQGKGDFMDNVRLAIAGVATMLIGYLVGSALPAAIKYFNFFAWSSSTAMLKIAAAGKVAFLGLGIAAAAALAYILLNWDEASYQIQQGFAKVAMWISDKTTWLAIKIAEIIGNIRKVVVSVRYAIAKVVANLFGWILQNAGKLVDNIVGKIGTGLGLIDKLFGTDLKSKLDESYKSLEEGAKDFKEKLLAGLDQAEIDAKAQIDYDVQLDTEMWQGVNEDAKKFWEGYMATSQRMYDEALAEKAKQEEEERKAQEEQNQREMEEMAKTMEKTMANVSMPEIEMPELATNFTAQMEGTEEVVANTANANLILGEAKDLQATANELSLDSNIIQANATKDMSTLVKDVGSGIISALKKVEDACRDIRINIHNHYGGGDDGYATGGYPTSGEYFFAREDGMPELVGRVGRRTAVMNNGQIADTMAQSLIRAIGQGGGSSQPQVIENKLYLDGEVVYANQQKIQRSKGYNLGMGVFANV